MAEQITNYKCPACSGPLHFAGGSGMMECEYCGSKYTVEEIEQRYAEADANAVDAKKEADNKPSGEDEWEVSTEQWNSEGMKSYTCPSCSATLLCEDTLAASSCPYCGNPTIVPGQFAGVLKPDYVIPFKLEKDAAVDALKKHYGKRYLLPKMFKDNNHLEEIKGVYVPFWLYDGKSSGDCVYEGVKKEVKKTATEQITTSRFYRVERKGKMSFEKIPADASTKMDDSLMESIEPYDYKDLKEFNKAYLTGYLADKYDVTAEENAPRAVARAKESTKNALRDDIKGYDSVTTKSTNIKVEQGKAYYAMMPVWMLNTNWNGKDYKFAMNGQTGRLVGDLPVDKGKLWGTVIVLFAALFALFKFAVGWQVGISLIVPAIIAGLTGLIMTGNMRSVRKKAAAGAYVTEGGIDITFRSDDFERQTIDKKPIQKAN
ncbi:MAG: hypothetical protein K6G69_07510 [Lachnospiraceae bacterium]|nr:hypothetical protein [Lachnospiraceae bacterium]